MDNTGVVHQIRICFSGVFHTHTKRAGKYHSWGRQKISKM